MNEEDIAARITRELDGLREHVLQGYSFDWLGHRFWVDRERRLVLDVRTAERVGAIQHGSVPGSQLAEVAWFACKRSYTKPMRIAELLGSIQAGKGPERE